jgi:hypothetical protein
LKEKVKIESKIADELIMSEKLGKQQMIKLLNRHKNYYSTLEIKRIYEKEKRKETEKLKYFMGNLNKLEMNEKEIEDILKIVNKLLLTDVIGKSDKIDELHKILRIRENNL